MTQEAREAIKASLGIKKSGSKNNCKNCYYHPLENICTKYHIKTDYGDSCEHYKKDTKFRFISGGGMSPK